MIKVNLLDSVTDRTRSVAVVEQRVANPRTRVKLLGSAVAALLVLGMAFDWMSAGWAHANAQTELERQQRIAAQMEAVNKEQAELEKKIKDIQVRIEAIKKLRSSQQGPVAVLSEVNQRLPAVSDFRLETIEQKAGELIIEGHSPNEFAVTQFGRSLEFSSGTFTNLSIETERKTLEYSQLDVKPGAPPIDNDAPKPETVKFKIRCKYTPPGGSSSKDGADAPALPKAAGQPNGAAAPAPQVAQN